MPVNQKGDSTGGKGNEENKGRVKEQGEKASVYDECEEWLSQYHPQNPKRNVLKQILL